MTLTDLFSTIPVLSKFLDEIWIVTLAVIFMVVSLGVAAIKFLTSSWEFYEKYLENRQFKNILNLYHGAKEETSLSKYLDKLKDAESFRLVSGIKTSPQKANMLMDLYLLGFTENSDLKKIGGYFEPKEGVFEIKVGWFDRVGFWWSFISMGYFFFSGILMGFLFIFQGSPLHILVGIVVMLLFLLAGILIGQGYRTSVVLKRVRTKLIKTGRLSNPLDKI